MSAIAEPQLRLTDGEQALVDQLRALGRGAAERAAAHIERFGLPHRRMETWKWSDLRRAVTPSVSLVSADGEGRLAESYDPLMAEAANPTSILAGALASDLDLLAGERGETEDFVLERRTPGLRADKFSQSGVLIEDLRVGPGLSANASNLLVREGATLEHIIITAGGPDSVRLCRTDVTVEASARYRQTALSFGASLSRLETHLVINGEDAEVTLNGASLLSGDAHTDHTTVVHHVAPGAVTREVFRSVVADRATGVFQGKIKVDREAQETDAQMNHGALLLSERATVNAKPELEIYADNVQCAHGNTAGALDADALHYMCARGLPEARAKALLVEAFVGEVLDDVAHEPTRERLRSDARAWMEARL